MCDSSDFGLGGGEDTISTNYPSSVSTSDAVQQWVQSLPAIYQTQMQYAPQEAAQQVQLAQQYAGAMGQAYKTAQEQMYPNETNLNNQLVKQAQEGIQSQVPAWQKNAYLSNLRSNLGANAGSGVGANYTSLGLMQQQEDWRKYYQSLGANIANKQPVYTAQTPQTTNYMSNFTPQGVMNYNAQNYATQAGIYGSQLGYNTGVNTANMNLLGSSIGALGTMGGAYLLASSLRYKTNIKLWA